MSIGIRNIGKRFGSFVALDNISLEIPTGELVGRVTAPVVPTTTPAVAATFSNNMPTNVGVGDAVEYDSDAQDPILEAFLERAANQPTAKAS